MKQIILLAMVLVGFQNVYGQNFNHTLGVIYNQFSGNFGNKDLVGLQYNPQVQRIRGNNVFGVSFPMSMDFVVTSQREKATSTTFELPLSFEWTYVPCGLCASYREMSIFVGGGISRVYTLRNLYNNSDYFNATAGVRLPVTRKSLELRMIYSRHSVIRNNQRLGVSLAYTL